MQLLINVLITSERLAFPHLGQRTRGLLDDPKRFDVFKYMLASLAAIPYWSKVILYVSLSDEFKPREEELENYVYQLFTKEKVSYYKERNFFQRQWVQALPEVLDHPDNLIWFLNNDDHIFIDYDLKTIEDAMNVLEQHNYASLQFSHWSEFLKGIFSGKPKRATNTLVVSEGRGTDGMQLITKSLLIHWLYSDEYGNKPLGRLDYAVNDIDRPNYVPLKECCRHFDAYYHINADVGECPALDIPPGFFENNIKICCYCEEKPESNWVLFNPLLPNYTTVDEKGADYRLMVEDIPLFWKNKITDIVVSENVDKNELIKQRNEAVWAVANYHHLTPIPIKLDKELIMSVAGRS